MRHGCTETSHAFNPIYPLGSMWCSYAVLTLIPMIPLRNYHPDMILVLGFKNVSHKTLPFCHAIKSVWRNKLKTVHGNFWNRFLLQNITVIFWSVLIHLDLSLLSTLMFVDDVNYWRDIISSSIANFGSVKSHLWLTEKGPVRLRPLEAWSIVELFLSSSETRTLAPVAIYVISVICP